MMRWIRYTLEDRVIIIDGVTADGSPALAMAPLPEDSHLLAVHAAYTYPGGHATVPLSEGVPFVLPANALLLGVNTQCAKTGCVDAPTLSVTTSWADNAVVQERPC